MGSILGTGLLSALAVAGPAELYLSEDFFPGYHIVERVDDSRFHVYARGQSSTAPPVLDLGGLTLAAAQERLESFLKIRPREPLQQPCAIFTAQGERVERDLEGHWVLFLVELGQWMWPAVRVDFLQNVTKLPGVRLRTLSLRPRVFRVENFMSEQEAADLMALGARQGLVESKGQMQSNDLKWGTSHASFRTSRQAWLHNELSPVVAELDARTATLMGVPASHNEPVQLLRYDAGNYYHAHMDWTDLDFYPDQKQIWLESHFGHFDRLATVFWYLNDVQQGGETNFPKHGQPICFPGSMGGPNARTCRGARDPEDMSSCANGLKVKPQRGTALLWYNFLATGRGDRNSLHAGCPVGENETKWSVNKWVRTKPLETPAAAWLPEHPALKRNQWRDNEDQVPCHLALKNRFASPVALLWINEDGVRQLTTIPPQGASAHLSYHGHYFQVKATDPDSDRSKRSNVVMCSAPSSDFEVTETLQLAADRSADRGEL